LSIGLITAACQAPLGRDAPPYVAAEAYGADDTGRVVRDRDVLGQGTGPCVACNAYDLVPGHDM
jgi:hypothetical protein